MIHEVAGDILLTKAQVIVHGVAANDPMDQGLALALHNLFPAMHKEYHHWCHQKHPEPGEAWAWDTRMGKKIVHLITQEGGYGHGHSTRVGKATLSHVRHSLRALRKLIEKEHFSSVSLPRLATGVGGLNWEEVWPVIQEQLDKLDIPIYVYKDYVPGQKAQEPGL
jgi:O-acetyl-ADP-ribose deacetylase (regulator of RNase III)